MSALEEVLAGHEGYGWTRDLGCWACRCGKPLTPQGSPARADDARAPWTAHVAAAVTAWITERLASEDVREAVNFKIRHYGPLDADPYQYSRYGSPADAALAAVTDALREGASCEVKPECDHPGIEHGVFSHTGICPACRKCKFIGHGPLCLDCYTSPVTEEQP